VVFNQWSEDLGGFIETISPNAFDNVDLEDIVLLYNHDTGAVLSRTSADTLSINIDENGLHFTGRLPDTTLGKDVLTNLRNGNIQGMS
ncbi:HK97 family phage prohead protease, partial [Neisseria gonorrhoeae]